MSGPHLAAARAAAHKWPLVCVLAASVLGPWIGVAVGLDSYAFALVSSLSMLPLPFAIGFHLKALFAQPAATLLPGYRDAHAPLSAAALLIPAVSLVGTIAWKLPTLSGAQLAFVLGLVLVALVFAVWLAYLFHGLSIAIFVTLPLVMIVLPVGVYVAWSLSGSASWQAANGAALMSMSVALLVWLYRRLGALREDSVEYGWRVDATLAATARRIESAFVRGLSEAGARQESPWLAAAFAPGGWSPRTGARSLEKLPSASVALISWRAHVLMSAMVLVGVLLVGSTSFFSGVFEITDHTLYWALILIFATSTGGQLLVKAFDRKTVEAEFLYPATRREFVERRLRAAVRETAAMWLSVSVTYAVGLVLLGHLRSDFLAHVAVGAAVVLLVLGVATLARPGIDATRYSVTITMWNVAAMLAIGLWNIWLEDAASVTSWITNAAGPITFVLVALGAVVWMLAVRRWLRVDLA